MKILVEFLCLISACLAATVPQYEPDYTTMFNAQDDPSNGHPNLHVTEKDLKIFFFSKTNEGQLLNITHPEQVKHSGYSPELNTVFLIHGWTNTYESPFGQITKNAYLEATNMNVFIVDWSSVAKREYVIARNQVVQVGNVLGGMISSMVKNNLLSLDKTSLVGHSLGAHVAGVTGKSLNGQLDHIVGLDPAGPLFFIRVERDRLDKSDAKFVQVLHTASGKLGFSEPLGHADYWPNGGHAQAGCSFQSDIVGSCSHTRAYLLYAESLITGNFYAWLCQNYETFESGACMNGLETRFGEVDINKYAHGNFYFNTNPVAPYAKGRH